MSINPLDLFRARGIPKKPFTKDTIYNIFLNGDL